jgi:hypothetical protein
LVDLGLDGRDLHGVDLALELQDLCVLEARGKGGDERRPAEES